MGKYPESELHFKRMLQIAKENKLIGREILAYNNLADVKVEQKAISEALEYVQKAYEMATDSTYTEMIEATARTLGRLYASIDSNQLAYKYYSQSLAISGKKGYQLPLTQTMIGLARLYIKQNKPDSALALAHNALNNGAAMGQVVLQRDAHELLSILYENEGNSKEALEQYKAFKFFSDSLNNLGSERAAANLEAERELAKRELKFQKITNTQRWVIFSAIAGLITLGVIVLLVTRHRNRLNLANQQLNASNKVMETQKQQLEDTVEQLKNTQTQLIHAEKMASLGELTAGIAHELKNPLNFIHNFSEVSLELLEEWKELDNSSNQEAAIVDKAAILNDVADNLAKINQHSKRADSVIQGMLQHSRKASINKEFTDIKALIEQTINLGFQGFKSVQKDFDASVEFSASPDLQKIAIIPQEIGRVVLNLLNNAFFAVYNKWKNQTGTTYIPKVEVAVYQQKEWVYILVKDNGMGMAEEIKAKVFQPFFTTKPTGQGTGLGLSISYDIITKGHNGTISVSSEAGAFTEFKIRLPIGSNA
ncbi:MAG: ATP-binding protein [Chitinophagaceae bacterium]|nr:ATP-binding protein [Chitinophagaceae bacterium]